MVVSLKDLEAIVDSLNPEDRLRLLQYLVPRLGDVPAGSEPSHNHAARAWQEFRSVGERLAATSNGVSLTQAVSDMRR